MARDELVSSVQPLLLGDYEYCSVAALEKKTGTRLEHWLQKTSSDLQIEEDKKVPVATDTDEAKFTGSDIKVEGRVVWLS